MKKYYVIVNNTSAPVAFAYSHIQAMRSIRLLKIIDKAMGKNCNYSII
jgi:hypothetical protein